LEQHQLVLGLPPREDRLAWEQPLSDRSAGLLMGYRRALEPLVGAMTDPATLRARLARLGYPWHEVAIHLRCPKVGPHRVAACARRLLGPGSSQPERIARADPPPPISRPGQPNYLTRLRDFAFGE
jgi:hypothetical protein